jgi:hypothetical protein
MLATSRTIVAALAILALAACVTTQPRTAVTPTTVYSDDGLSELIVPDTWRTRPNLGKSGTIRVADEGTENYLLVNTYLPHEHEGKPFAQFAERVSARLMKGLRGGKLSAPKSLTISGRPALEYEISGVMGSLPLVYLSTVVDGENARHHLVAWTLGERYSANRDAMREAASSFRESAQKRAARNRTDLTFDWPERMTATATVRSKSSKRGEVIEMSMRSVSTVRPLGEDQLLISGKVTDKKFTPALKDKGKADYLERLLKEAMTDVPDYVVDRDGEFVRTENLGPYVKRLEEALVEGLPQGPNEGRAKARQLVQTFITEQTLNTLVQDEWNNIVGNWADGSYVQGELYELQMSYQSAVLGEQTFAMHVTRQLAGREPCRNGAAANSCVRLVQVSRVSDPSFSRATGAFVRKTVGADVSVDKAEVVKSVEVLADPDTLLPYRTVVKETKTFVISAKGEAPRTSVETRESTTLYSY